VRHDHDQTVRETGDIRAAAGPRQLHFRTRAIVADGGGVEIPVSIDLSAPDEARLDLATLQESHEVDRARAPDGASDIRRIAHRVQELG